MKTADPLEALVIDTREVDRDRLASILDGRVGVDPEQGTIRFRPGVKEDLTIRQLALIALLAQQALHLLDEEHPEGLKPSVMAEVTGVQGNSLRAKLSQLAAEDLVYKNGEDRYVVPDHAFDAVERELEGSHE